MQDFHEWLIPLKKIVRDPRTMHALDAQGEWKIFIGPEGRYWRRRVRVGDCAIGSPPRKDKKKK